METFPAYEHWEQLPKTIEIGPAQKIIDNIIESRMKKGKILDVCCGTGINAEYLTKKGFEVDGVDLSMTITENQGGKEQTLFNLPFKRGGFDLVVDLGCFNLIKMENKTQIIHEIHDLLKNGGFFLLVFPLSDYISIPHTLTEKQIVSYFSEFFKLKFVGHYPLIAIDGSARYFNVLLLERKD